MAPAINALDRWRPPHLAASARETEKNGEKGGNPETKEMLLRKTGSVSNAMGEEDEEILNGLGDLNRWRLLEAPWGSLILNTISR